MDWVKLLELGLALFVVVDPIGLLPMYMGLTAQMSESERRRTTNVAVVSGATILLAFSVVGEWMLARVLHVTAFELMVAGGLLLLLIGIIGTLFGERSYQGQAGDTASHRVGAVPIGCPLLAGPGAITTTILIVNSFETRAQGMAAAALLAVAVFALAWVVLRYTAALHRLLGEVGSLVVTRLMHILLAAIGVHYLVEGIRGLLAATGAAG